MKAKIGLDEVGRGCLAGPVMVAAVLTPARFKYPTHLPELKDSKLMTPLQREVWYEWLLKEGSAKNIIITVSSVSSARIDKMNISAAANFAAWRALKRVIAKTSNARASVILDGGLFIKDRAFQKNKKCIEDFVSIKTIIGADRKVREVKLASVIAKVTRDRYMKKVAMKYPKFGFEYHKGYGTREHIKAIRRVGLIEKLHRKTFLKKYS